MVYPKGLYHRDFRTLVLNHCIRVCKIDRNGYVVDCCRFYSSLKIMVVHGYPPYRRFRRCSKDILKILISYPPYRRFRRICKQIVRHAQVIRRIGGLEVPDVTTSAHVIVIRRIGGLEVTYF